MYIRDNTIYLKSSSSFYYKEICGIKNNTVRILTLQQLKVINKNSLKLIEISLKNAEYEFFIRRITDISIYKYLNINIVIFTWEV